MAAVESAFTAPITPSSVFQVGLHTDIFQKSKAKDPTPTPPILSASANGILSASGQVNLLSSIIGMKNSTSSTVPTPGLHNSGNWLTASGNFMFASGTFPFLPPLGDDTNQSVREAAFSDAFSHSNKVDQGVDHPKLEEDWKVSKIAVGTISPPAGTPTIKPTTMSNLYKCNITPSPNSKSQERPMAYWRTSTHQLSAFNAAFAELIECPINILQDGFLWTSIGVVDQDTKLVHLSDSGNNALKAIYEFTQMIISGSARYSQISFSFVTGAGKLKHMHVIMVAFHEDVLWLCTEIGAEPMHSSSGSTSTTSTSNSSSKKQKVSHPQDDDSSDKSGSPRQLVETTTPSGERKLVKVTTRKKKPWDQNLVKFSLKKMRKRSKKNRPEGN